METRRRLCGALWRFDTALLGRHPRQAVADGAATLVGSPPSEAAHSRPLRDRDRVQHRPAWSSAVHCHGVPDGSCGFRVGGNDCVWPPSVVVTSHHHHLPGCRLLLPPACARSRPAVQHAFAYEYSSGAGAKPERETPPSSGDAPGGGGGGGGGGADPLSSSGAVASSRILTAASTPAGVLPPLNTQKLFKTFGLQELTEDELHEVFTQIDRDGDGVLSAGEVELALRKRFLDRGVEQDKLDDLLGNVMRRLDTNRDGMVSEQEFMENIREMAGTVDRRVYHLAACMGVAGISMGLTIPLMPQLVSQLGLTVQDFGMATSAFGALKMLSNFPSAYAVDKFGRVPVLTGGLAAMACSFAALISASSAATLAAARGLNGAGASGFLTSATSYVVDISNPLNRARSMAPLFTAFSAGAAIGPVIGGLLASVVSMHTTFALMGGLYASMALYCRLVVPETLRKAKALGSAPGEAAATAAAKKETLSWASILRKPAILDTVCLNFVYSGIQAGAQMTLLPLLLTQGLGMDTAAAGMAFAGMAAVNVLGAQMVANTADRFGSQLMIGPAGLAISSALMALPMVHDSPAALVPIILLWATGNTVMGSNPTTHVSTLAPPSQKVQAIAVLRTTGDMGFLLGGIGSGVLAELSSIEAVLGGSGAVFCSAASVYITRDYFRRRAMRSVASRQKD